MAAHNDHQPADYRHRDRIPVRRALLSVSDKTGIIELAKNLVAQGIEIVSTGGTFKALADAGLPVIEVSQLTGFPESLDGRVKTLHPTIHGGLLADMRLIAHEEQLKELDIQPFQLVVVNLYPFVQTVQSGAKGDAVVEQIDIGGPAMVRASAKNHANVAIVVDPARYGEIIAAIEEGGTTLQQRRELAYAAFSHTARYDSAVSAWFASELENDWKRNAGQTTLAENANPGFEAEFKVIGNLENVLRYGENSHQAAALYRTGGSAGIAQARQFGGKEMSYNNFVDADAAVRAAYDFSEPAVAIIKHANPCGIALGDLNSADAIADAHAKAHMCDPVSAFGGVIASNRIVTVAMAKQVATIFTEVIVAPGYEIEALQILLEKKNLRVLELPANYSRDALEYRQISGGLLVQQPDEFSQFNSQGWKLVTGKKADADTMRELEFAWRACRAVKSNGILLARELASVGVGMGQVNRVDSCRLAVERAESRAKGSVAASDAFFPFADGLQILINAGVRAVVQPGGSVRDEEVIAAAEAAGVTMYFTGERHFFH
ncbi:bifunctional phosphoribosylaminoimidazolecarboxamide formyltransferase/IMP cyclohydrolase [Candidatus Rhodoluna planktonica]|uniref:Bifunctional purine biosynthesis protein PurH n=1 Tax=Candidatus Rhodoluna planktonica TaxID=535712 RepID=A0A1D9E058_9MICO|nr:bifunctional phosphoribosylaminoimidazolecarboxamide formyltransferase/IMP cyclohydrolase [Candidatus Rhodoluna planktonica]AOY56436.1 bifunctional phosphoribosylaminoimidazolecarboxamide formyltransferase/inosine monophosphate cyclohydrolase [Candidatus Rhodoluna planktonica]